MLCTLQALNKKLIIDADFDKNKGYYKMKQVRRMIKGKTVGEQIIKENTDWKIGKGYKVI